MSGELEPEGEFIKRSMAVMGRKHEISFKEVVRQYRQIEAEFVERAGDNETQVIETKRSTSQWLLMEAERTEQPHEVCQEIWEELVQQGFSVVDLKHLMSRTYARCCQNNGEFDAGIAVLDPLITEIEQHLKDSTLTPVDPATFGENLRFDNEMRDELKAGIRKWLMPRGGPREPEEIALTQRINAVDLRERKQGLRFKDAVREYRQIETEFVERAGDNEGQAIEARRRIREALLESAYGTNQSHEVCRKLWEELVQLGFTNDERRHTMSRLYVRCCLLNGEFDTGLAVIEKLINDLAAHLEDPMLSKEIRDWGERALRIHRRLRDKLKAGIQ